jgi:hypothetical protein
MRLRIVAGWSVFALPLVVVALAAGMITRVNSFRSYRVGERHDAVDCDAVIAAFAGFLYTRAGFHAQYDTRP